MGVGLEMAKLTALAGGQAGGSIASGAEPYGFTPEFERALVYYCASNRDVYSRVGALLNPKSMTDKVGVQLLKAAQAIAAELGEGPSSSLTAVQRLRAWREDGKITIEVVQDAIAYLDAAEDAGLPSVNEVVTETANLLKKRAKRENVKKALATLSKGGDFAKLGAEIAATERIGEGRQTLGETIHTNIVDELVAANNAAKLPTGCMELDGITGGGLPIGYTLFLGREKSGKSMVLSSIAAESLTRQQNVAIATLELAGKKQIERVLANILACSIYEVQTGAAIVRNRLATVAPNLGKLQVQHFQPDTPVSEVLAWVDRLKVELGHIDLLVVDYADLVGAGKVGKDANGYTDAKVVGNAFRNHAMEGNYVTISAAQGKRGSGTGGKPLDMDDGADSQHKVRIADLVIAMRMEMDQKDMVDWTIVGARDGNDRLSTGPLPTHKEMGRMFPVNRSEPW